ncbi:MAG: HNH endonuclease [Bacilli bacterium]|nr:HNH endonuclease [Bacilli bacterium]
MKQKKGQKKKKRKKQTIKDDLKILYGCRDMLTGLKSKALNFHHIVKRLDDGKRTIENGALLEQDCHDWLHYFEIIDPDIYKLVNECLVFYKNCLDLGYLELVEQYETDIFPVAQNSVNEYISRRKK